jgi:hypothetical protein
VGAPGAVPVYCSEHCRRRWSEEHDPDDHVDDESIMAVRKRLEQATFQTRTCACPNPIGLVDADGEATCFRCGWPLARDQVHELPPAA